MKPTTVSYPSSAAGGRLYGVSTATRKLKQKQYQTERNALIQRVKGESMLFYFIFFAILCLIGAWACTLGSQTEGDLWKGVLRLGCFGMAGAFAVTGIILGVIKIAH